MNNQLERSNRAWEILATCAKAKRTITYGDIAKILGMHHRPVRFVLAPIQDYCLERHLPPLTILVINQSGRPGHGFFAWDADRFDEGLEEVYSYQWQKETNPFAFGNQIGDYNAMLRDLLKTPDTAGADVFAKVKVRGIAQLIFRDLLLRAYEKRCAFSNCWPS
jgi:putative restriction endonuclease